VGFNRTKPAARTDESRQDARAERGLERTSDKLRKTGRVGFDQARGDLGFGAGERDVRWAVDAEADALQAHVPVPGVLADIAGGRDALMGVGGALDLFESEEERRKRLMEMALTAKLRGTGTRFRSVGELMGGDPAHDEAPKGVQAMQRAFRPSRAMPEKSYSASVEFALGGNGTRIDVSSGDLPRLVHFALENGVDWVYDEIDKVRAWADAKRPEPQDED
jgi:hypothetical protein